MKVTVTREYSLPEEQEIYNIHNEAEDIYSALEDIRIYIRNRLKYSEISEDTDSELRAVYDLLPPQI